ncbi:MAG: Yip1 family protein [Oceanicaulis sp.]
MNEPLPPASVTPRSLFERAKAIILKPTQTWARIDGEQTPVRELFLFYALPLAAIGPVAGFLGGQIFGRGQSILGTLYRPSFFNALFAGVVQYVFALIGVAVLAFIINAFARQFGGVSNRVQAFKVAVYGSTAAWLAGIFQLVPALSVLGIVGLYSLYLIYLGLPKLMKAPQDKALIYVIVTVVTAVLVWVVAGALGAALTPRAVI